MNKTSIEYEKKNTNTEQSNGDIKSPTADKNSKKKTQLSTSASSNTENLSSKNIGHYILGMCTNIFIAVIL